MTTQLTLDKKTHDLIKPEYVAPGAMQVQAVEGTDDTQNGGVQRTDEGRFVVQQVACKLKTTLTEWILDTTVGWLNSADFEKGYDLFDIENRAREIILGTKGVDRIITMHTEVEDRILYLSFEAATIYGDIDLTVPWSIE